MGSTDSEVDALINSARRSGGRPGYRFNKVGDKIVGTVVSRNVVMATPMGGGEKVPNLVLEMDTDDELSITTSAGETISGTEWAVWIKSPSQLLGTLTSELSQKSAPAGSPRPGDRLAIAYRDNEPSKTPGWSPKKIYEVTYKAAAPATVSSVEDIL